MRWHMTLLSATHNYPNGEDKTVPSSMMVWNTVDDLLRKTTDGNGNHRDDRVHQMDMAKRMLHEDDDEALRLSAAHGHVDHVSGLPALRARWPRLEACKFAGRKGPAYGDGTGPTVSSRPAAGIW